MASTSDLPYSFCKRYGVIAALSPVTGKLRLTLKHGAPADAVTEVQPLLGMIDEIEVESDIGFNQLLGQHLSCFGHELISTVKKYGFLYCS